MEIRAYQDWIEQWDRARGWDRVSVAHTLVHALEELGELARLILQREGYKDVFDPSQLQAALEEELADVFVFLFKLAYQTGVDVDAALTRGQVKANGRYEDVAEAEAMLQRYHDRQRALLAGLTRISGE